MPHPSYKTDMLILIFINRSVVLIMTSQNYNCDKVDIIYC